MVSMIRKFGWLAILCCGAVCPAADWATARGNAARTGCIDDQPGPTQPKVLWHFGSKEHFIASPVATDKEVILSGLGAFNAATVYALSTTGTEPGRAVWMKIPPFLKLPTVSAPAVVDGKLYFGDGMHQTDGASLHCLRAATGLPVWRYSIPGALVHIEGTPTVVGSRVYFGGGHAGIVCLDTSKLTLEGKEVTAAEAEQAIEDRWKKLLANFEVERKKDPDFAVPPSENDLPQAAPKLAWQQGKEMWHIDAPVAVVGDRLYVCTSYLEAEKTGERAVLCLSAADGSLLWKSPLKLNPWSGVSVSGDKVLVAGSSCRFDTKEIPGAKGEVTCLNAADGKEVWRRDVPGGVLSSPAIAGKRVVFAATDGKVRSLDLDTGMRGWSYDAKAPLFAAPAVDGAAVYAADLKGNVHAFGLTDAKPRWTLSLAAAPVNSNGMVYGSPVAAGGKIYVATCNPESANETRNAVVCIGGP